MENRRTVTLSSGEEELRESDKLSARMSAREQIGAGPDQRISASATLTDQEREQILYEWNATEREYRREKCVHELFEEQVARNPEAVAVVCGEQEVTYRELNRRANRLGHYLRGLGVKPEARVAICVERSLEMVIGFLGVLKAGGGYVPLDPSYPAERLRYMLEDSGTEVVLASKEIEVPALAGVRRVDLAMDEAVWSESEGEGAEEGAGENLEVEQESESLAYIMYTSGSTGQAKGVMVPHRGINRLVINGGYAKFEAGDGVAWASNPAFDASTMELWGPLLNGGRVVVIEQEALLDAGRLGEELRRQRVSIVWMTVGLFNQYAELLREEFSRLRYLIVGGDALDAGVMRRVLGEGAPEHLINGYGPTETTTFAVTHEIKGVEAEARSIPIGRPIGNTRVYILDEEWEPVPVGVAGEIYIGGAGVARGYVKRPELTAERFVPDGYSREAGARIYRTGDLGRWLADGTIEFLGRNDNQVKIRGFRIELGEIESRLTEHPEVREAVVVAREDTPGEKRLVAYYTVAGEDEVGAEELRAHLGARLPAYMVPAAYVWLEKLPLTVNGKLDRKALPEPEGNAYPVREYEAPQGETETALAEIWSELLGVERVGRWDNFFELGGHSLLAMRVVSRIRQGLRVAITIVDLFERPTLSGLADHVLNMRLEQFDSGEIRDLLKLMRSS